MKIRILLLVVCLTMGHVSNAQDQEIKQQFFVSVGLLDMSYIEKIPNFFGNSRSISGVPGVGLFEYRISKNRLGVGISAFSRSLDQDVWGEKRSHRFFGILPHFDLYWVNQKKYQVSSQMAVGYRFGETTTTNENNSYFRSLYSRPAFQFIPLSVTYGNGNWFGRFEVGIGHKGFGTLGLGLRL